MATAPARRKIAGMDAINERVTGRTPRADLATVTGKQAGSGSPSRAAFGALLLALVWPLIGCNNTVRLAPEPAVRYIAFGDSGTAGRSGRSYPTILAELLEQPPEVIANHGHDGEATAEGLDRLRGLLALSGYPNAEVLLYWEGGADIIDFMREVDRLLLLSPLAPSYPHGAQLVEMLDRVQANIETVIAEGRAAGLTVYVATYFSSREAVVECDAMFLDVILPFQARNANGYVALLNERIRQAAANAGATVVDIASLDDVLHADEANFLNCNHLSAQGNAIIARLFADALTR